MTYPTHLIPTTIVGSYPQPDWLVDRDALAHHPPRPAPVRRIGALMSATEAHRSIGIGPSAHAYASGGSIAVLILLVCLLVCLLAGCAQRDSGSEKDRPDGFYGGVSGGKGM
jgi:hypothetical protein